MVSEEKDRRISNVFIKKIPDKRIEGLINYVFHHTKPVAVIRRDDTLSAFRVYYGPAGPELTVTIDDFEGIFERFDPPIPRPGRYMSGEQLLRFQAWMYRHFGKHYMDELTRSLQRKISRNTIPAEEVFENDDN